MTEHPRDPRARRNPFAPPRDAAGAAAALEAAAGEMRASWLEQHPAPVDEPPTGLLDLAAIRAALGDDPGGAVNPAAAAWLAGRDEPEPVFGAVYVDEALELTADALADVEPEPSPDEQPLPPVDEFGCEVLGNAFHSDGPCGPAQHPVADVSVPDPEPVELPPSPSPAPVPPVPPPAPAPVLVRQADVEARAAAERAQTVRAFIPEQATDRRLSWRSRHDERSRAYGVRARLAGSAALTDHAWPVGPVLDQGVEGACVGFGIVDAVNAMTAGGPDGGAGEALALYRAAQRLDDVPGENYTGTSVLAGLQAAQTAGLVGGYTWCFGTKDVAQAVLQRGPVVIGIPWPAGWFDVPADGLLTLDGDVGDLGHCLAVVGIKMRGPAGQLGPYFTLQNSYGPGWGDRGFGYLHHRDLAALLHGTGEAAVPTTDPVQP